ncbi:MAG: VanZ family protein, partial [Eubacteriales bacterium]|nr:VanZ family protein [Eubacteriales bacterium]
MITWQQYVKYMKRYLTFSNSELVQMACVCTAMLILLLICHARVGGLNGAVKKGGVSFAFAIWTSFIIGVTLLNRQPLQYHLVRVDVLNIIKNIFNGSYFEQYHAISNILLFVPYGLLLPFNITWCKKWWKHMLVCFASSMLVETGQYVLFLGTCDAIDLITNLLGGIAGYIVYRGIGFVAKCGTV